MKKQILLLTCISIPCLHAMKMEIASFGTIFRGTEISIVAQSEQFINIHKNKLPAHSMREQLKLKKQREYWTKNKSLEGLAKYYTAELSEGINLLEYENKQSVTLPLLHPSIDIIEQQKAACIIATVITFIQFYQNIYTSIQIPVQELSDVAFYKDMLMSAIQQEQSSQ